MLKVWFLVRLTTVTNTAEQADQPHAKAVPVADLIADLDIHDGVTATLLAAAQQACCTQSNSGCAGALEERTAGNGIRHKEILLIDRKKRIPEYSNLFIPFLPARCKGFGAEFTAFSQEYHPSGERPFTCVSLVLTRFNRLGV